MAEIAGATVTWTDYTGTPSDPRLLNVPDAVGDVTVQDLVDTLSAQQAELDALIYDPLLDIPDTSGKQVLSATKQVGITCVMVRCQIKFEDLGGPTWTIKRITDGNLAAIDGEDTRNLIPKIASSTYVNFEVEADVSAALIGSGFTATDAARLERVHQHHENRFRIDVATSEMVLYGDDGTTVLRRWPLRDKTGAVIRLPYGVQTERGVPEP